MSFRSVDFQCELCGEITSEVVDLRGLSEEEREIRLTRSVCECGGDTFKIWLQAPSIKHGKDSDLSNIDKMKQSFKERFVKKELDDVRHKHGRLFDDSLRSAAAQKIKKE